jgi:fibrillarin-like rRNA methylase
LSNDLTPLMVEYAERTVDDILEVRTQSNNLIPMGGYNDNGA